MVYFRYFPLIGVLFLVLVTTGCATSTGTPARVEDHSLPQEQNVPATGKEPVRETVPSVEERQPVGKAEELPAPVAENNEATVSKESSRPQQAGPAVVALLDDAEQYSNQGENQRAIASVERALRIEPKNPVLWNRLSHLHLQQGNWVQSIAMAKKSNVLAGDDLPLQHDNWQVIARARQGLGDDTGAREAAEKARQLQR